MHAYAATQIVDSVPLTCHISHTVHRHSHLPAIRRTDSLLSHTFVLAQPHMQPVAGYLPAVDSLLYAGSLPAYDTPQQFNLSSNPNQQIVLE